MSRINYLILVAIVGIGMALATALSVSANHPPGPPAKVTICHKPGTPAQKTLTLPHPAAEHHIAAHGDTLGPLCAPPVCGGL